MLGKTPVRGLMALAWGCAWVCSSLCEYLSLCGEEAVVPLYFGHSAHVWSPGDAHSCPAAIITR